MIISFNTGKVETKGGSTGLLQQKKVTVTENGMDVIVPDAGYDGLSTVYVKTYVSDATGKKDFSVIGYDEELNTQLNEEIDANIAYSKDILREWKISNSSPSIYNNQDIVYCPVLSLKNSQYSYLTFKIENCTNLEVIPDLDLQQVSDFRLLSNGKLRKVGITNWKMSDVATNHIVSFKSCSSLKSLDLTTLNTSKMTDLSYVFYYCTQLNEIKGIEDWDVSNVTKLSYAFEGCKSLISMDLSNWNVSNVTSMALMYKSCEKLTSLNLSGWDTSNLTYLYQTFYNCSKLKSLDLSGWDVSKVYDFGGIFSYCSQLTDLNISGWDLSLDKSDAYLPSFSDCANLTNLRYGYNRKRNAYFTAPTKLTVESLLSIIDGLYDFTGNGITPPSSSYGKLYLGSTNLAKLSDEQKALVTNKGWTLS